MTCGENTLITAMTLLEIKDRAIGQTFKKEVRFGFGAFFATIVGVFTPVNSGQKVYNTWEHEEQQRLNRLEFLEPSVSLK